MPGAITEATRFPRVYPVKLGTGLAGI